MPDAAADPATTPPFPRRAGSAMIDRPRMPPAMPPTPRTRAEHLVDALTREIVDGRLPPGERLDEHSLAGRFGVSRTPVREALKRLAGLNLIELRPHRGAVVVALPATGVGELFEALAEAEAACARLAALKAGPADREAMEAAHRAFLCAADDPSAVPDANRAFHEAIYAGARNAVLAEAVTALRQRLAPFTRAQFRVAERPSNSAREHEAVLAAIRSGDPEAAAAAMRRHVTAVGEAWAAWAAGGG